MIALVNGATLRLVASTEGEDLTGWTEIALAADYDPELDRWDGAAWVRDWSRLDADLHAKIDAEAGVARCWYITDVPGQQLTYQRKEDEARRWVAATEPAIADYPFLAAESAATQASADDAAAAIIAAADLWAAIGSAIEGARIGAKRAVTAAATRTEKEAAAAVDWEAVCAGA